MKVSPTTRRGQALSRIFANKHALTFAGAGVLLTGASVYFNGSFGYEHGGIGMMLALVGFAVAKDAGISFAWAARGSSGRVAAGLVGAIGFGVSCLAALGASSHGREASANPLQAQIDAYRTAEKTEQEVQPLLSGKRVSVAEATGARDTIQVDPVIWKRTKGCQDLAANKASIIDANRSECRKWLAADALVKQGVEQDRAQQKLDEARAVLAKGRPASSDAQASSIAKLLRLDRIDGVQAVLNIVLALSIETIAPLCWAAFTSSNGGPHTPPTPDRAPVPSSPPKLTVVRGKRPDDKEIEAVILADVVRGIHRGQEDYARQFGVSIATISRALDRLEEKPDARIASRKQGTRRVLYAIAN